jgi:hypothetical protein
MLIVPVTVSLEMNAIDSPGFTLTYSIQLAGSRVLVLVTVGEAPT